MAILKAFLLGIAAIIGLIAFAKMFQAAFNLTCDVIECFYPTQAVEFADDEGETHPRRRTRLERKGLLQEPTWPLPDTPYEEDAEEKTLGYDIMSVFLPTS